uniref:Leukotriene-B4 omega-hydroxylase 3-like n=1 Tax=Phallusia mammillata TaxID=59560 RepID=A0A6F9DB81_9ASCI|nr:leukotriene-B4 omega-hydroxylase 3-like [Phallusia mammillata]
MFADLPTLFLNSGTGYIFSSLLGDTVFILACVYIFQHWIRPLYLAYRESADLSRRGWSPPRHPFWGHLQFLTPDEKGLKCRLDWVRKCGDMLVTWVGPVKVFVEPHRPTTIGTILLSSAPKDEFIYGFLRPWIGDGLLTSSGDKWKRHRKLLTPAFHFEVLKSYMKVYNHCASIMIGKWEARKENAMIEVSSDVAQMTLDVMLQCAMSAETNCQLDSENRYVQAVTDLAKIIVDRVNSLLLQIDWVFWLSPPGRRFKRALDYVHSEAERLIKERRIVLSHLTPEDQKPFDLEYSDIGIKKKGRLDFIDILLRSKDDEGKGLNDSEIRDEVDTFLFEGHDTTSSAISWILYNLARHPRYQQRCREEILNVMGDNEEMEWGDINKLLYLTMCIKESLRLHTPVQVIARSPEEKMTFANKGSPGGQMDVYPNTTVMVNLWAIHRNQEVWKNPEQYDPDRFLPENVAKMHPTAFVAFSAGPRNCIGKTFAMNELKVTLSLILRKFELFVDEETPKPRMNPRLILRSENGIHIKLRKLKKND